MTKKKAKKKRATRTPPCPAYPLWTTGKFWGFVRGHLRRMFMRWPPKYQALEDAKRDFAGKGRQKFEYQCASCKEWFKQKDVDVDHIEPAGSLLSFDDLPMFVNKLLPPKEGLQVLCKPCHKLKTKEERSNGTNNDT